MKAIYVQSICGYDGRGVYERRAARLTEFGFIALRSEFGDDGKRWEIWYLPGEFAAQGSLKGKPHEAILRAVMQEVRPGTIDVTESHFGLGID